VVAAHGFAAVHFGDCGVWIKQEVRREGSNQ